MNFCIGDKCSALPERVTTSEDVLFSDVQVLRDFLSSLDYFSVLGLNFCNSDLAWHVELRRLRKRDLWRVVKFCL